MPASMPVKDGEIVPFGKYKGQPVEVLAADSDYCEWLTSQPWFKSRYLNVYNTIINYGAEPQDSPEHNQMQARFLEDEWCFRLADLLSPGRKGRYGLKAAHGLLANDPCYSQFRDCCELEESDAGIVPRQFEDRGWDVTFGIDPAMIVAHRERLSPPLPPCTCKCDHSDCPGSASCQGGKSWCHHSAHEKRRINGDGHCRNDCYWSYQGPLGYSGLREWLQKEEHYYQPAYEGTIHVELKPDLGDDYPSVLRQVKGYPSDGYRDQRCVIVRRHAFQAVTWEQVVKIFAASGIRLLAEAEV